MLLAGFSRVPATSRTRSDPGQEQAASTDHISFSSLPLEDVQPTMGSADQVIDNNGDWEDELINIEPSSVHSKHDVPLQTSPGNVDPVLQLSESLHQSARLNTSNVDEIPLPSPYELVELRKLPPQSWEGPREPQAEVGGGRIMLKKMNMQLRARKEKLNNDKDLIWQELIELENLRTKYPTLIEKYEEITAAQQRLRPAELEYDKTEEQLNNNEWHQSALESTVYGDPLSPLGFEFPAGWLDFTGEEPRRASSRSSLASVLSPSLQEKEKKDYESCLKEADAWREKKLNLESEHEQLLQQKAKRMRLGVTLDSLSQEILESYDGDLKYLISQLEQAEARLEHAEVVWTRRKATLEQISQVNNSNANTVVSPLYTEPNNGGDDASSQEEYFYKLADVDEVFPEHKSDLASNIARILHQSEAEPAPIFRVPSLNSNGQHVNMATFINQWLLQRVRECPEEQVRLANCLASKNPGLTAEQAIEASLSTWLSDGSEKEFFIAVEAGDHSVHESLAPNNGLVRIVHDRATSQRPLTTFAVRPGGRVAKTYN